MTEQEQAALLRFAGWILDGQYESGSIDVEPFEADNRVAEFGLREPGMMGELTPLGEAAVRAYMKSRTESLGDVTITGYFDPND